MFRKTLIRQAQQHRVQLHGVIVAWHPFDRKGRVRVAPTTAVDGTDKPSEYSISGTGCFESLMPTMHRNLEGVRVQFSVDTARPDVAVGIVIDSSTLPARAPEKMREDAERDYLDEGLRPVSAIRDLRPKTIFSQEYLAEVRSNSSPAASAPSNKEADTKTTAPPPEQYSSSARIVDRRVVRAESLLDEVLRKRHAKPVTAAAAAESLRGQGRGRDTGVATDGAGLTSCTTAPLAAATSHHRVLRSGERLHGVVLAWSTLRRTGVVIEIDECDEVDAVVAHWRTKGIQRVPSAKVFQICGAGSFLTAMPSSQEIAGRRVRFVGVACTAGAGEHDTAAEQDGGRADGAVKRLMAEEIEVVGAPAFNAVEDLVRRRTPNTDGIDAASAAGKRIIVAGHSSNSPRAGDDREVGPPAAAGAAAGPSFLDDDEPVPEGPLYGVIIRWSGGQGVIESSKGRLFYIESAAEFEQLVDHHAQHLRGAVVEFRVEEATRRRARAVTLLSGTLGNKRLLSRSEVAAQQEDSQPSSAAVDPAAPPDPEETKQPPQPLPDAASAEWIEGSFVVWSPAEQQGIIAGDGGIGRFVVHNAKESIHDFSKSVAKIAKGRRVRFVPSGTTGRVATHVVVLEQLDEGSEGDPDMAAAPAGGRSESALSTTRGSLLEASREAEAARRGESGGSGGSNPCSPSEEALGFSSQYWIQRLERSGFDVRDYRKIKESVTPLTADDAPDDLIEKDPWYNDPTKNVKIPGTNVRRGDLARIGPASMVDLSMRMRDPEMLQKQKKKVQDKLTPEQHEYAMRKAKEHAPRYLEFLRKSQSSGSKWDSTHGFM